MVIVEEEVGEILFWLEFTFGLSQDYRSQITPFGKEEMNYCQSW